MNGYVTGEMIRRLREERHLTQAALAQRLFVSDKTVSKWETGKGYPDVALIEPLSRALEVSVAELLTGEPVVNGNRHFNMRRVQFYVCPVCGNVLMSTGEAVVCCHGITLPPLSAEEPDKSHTLATAVVEDEYYVTADHPMSKEHYLSFLAAVTDTGVEMIKLYPEGAAEARFKIRGTRMLYAYCNHHGLFAVPVRRT